MPEFLAFNAVDWIVIAVLALSTIMGYVRGLVRELHTALAIIAATVAALLYLRNNEGISILGFIEPAALEVAATGALLFAVTFLVVSFATSSLAALIHRSAEIGAVDRGAGAAYGFVRAAVIVVLGVVLARHTEEPPQLKNAKIYPVLNRGAVVLEGFIADKRPVVREKLQQAIGAREEDDAK